MIQVAADQNRYTRVAIALHWAIVGCIAFNLTLGYFMEGLRPAWNGVAIPLHIVQRELQIIDLAEGRADG